jgi:hypothetical protein
VHGLNEVMHILQHRNNRDQIQSNSGYYLYKGPHPEVLLLNEGDVLKVVSLVVQLMVDGLPQSHSFGKLSEDFWGFGVSCSCQNPKEGKGLSVDLTS